MPKNDWPQHLLNQRAILIAEIEDAFAGVTREGGVSWGQAAATHIVHEEWTEANVPKPEHLFKGRDITWRQYTRPSIDEHGGPDIQQRVPARLFHDGDKCWQDLVADPDWDPQADYGGFPLLDPIGSRYYLPAAMLRCLEDPDGAVLSFLLTVGDGLEELMAIASHIHWRAIFLERWSELNHRQRTTVKHFVQFRAAREEERLRELLVHVPEEDVAEVRAKFQRRGQPWHRAYASYWVNLDES